MGTIIEEEFQGLPLSFLHRKCSVAYENLSNIVNSKQLDSISDVEKSFTAFDNAVDSRDIFSSNEEQDDVSTGDLKYLLAPFYRAEFASQIPTPGPETRLGAIQAAMRAYDKFLTRASQYDVLGAIGKNVRKAQFESQGRSLDPSTKRNLKIEKFKRDKAISQRIQALREKGKALKIRDDEDEEGTGDEDAERELWILQLESACLKALEQQGMLEAERDMLAQIVSQQEDARARGSDAKEAERKRAEDAAADAEARAAMAEKLRGIAESLQQHGRTRQQIKEEVFRPGFLPPTMTLHELADQEMADAMAREQRQAKGERKEQARKDAMTEDDLDAEEKDKQAKWDDWRDWHPKGAGNSKLKPCG